VSHEVARERLTASRGHLRCVVLGAKIERRVRQVQVSGIGRFRKQSAPGYLDQQSISEPSLSRISEVLSAILEEPVVDTPLPTGRECVIVSGYPEVSPAQDRIRFSCDQRQPDSVIFLCSTLHGLHRV
jgi:hypothetical protein